MGQSRFAYYQRELRRLSDGKAEQNNPTAGSGRAMKRSIKSGLAKHGSSFLAAAIMMLEYLYKYQHKRSIESS